MNERILQLAKQAGLDDDMFPLDEWDNPELEKFAELIVKECAKIAAYQGACMPEYKILKHFGVKE